jgi:hypothetical protein
LPRRNADHDLTRTSASEQLCSPYEFVAWNLLPRCYTLLGWMIWFFDKDGEKLRYEISHDRINGRYRVVITRPDGTESVEEVDEPTALIERSVELMNSLRGDGWRVA